MLKVRQKKILTDLCKMFNFVRIYGVRKKNTGRNQNNTGQEHKRQASSHLMPCPLERRIKTNKRQAQATSEKG